MEKIKLKNFGLLMGGVLALVAGGMVYRRHLGFALAVGALATAFTLAALIAPFCLKEVYSGWMRFAKILGTFNTKLILGFIYVVIFTPVRLYFLVTGKDPLKRKFEPGLASYWEDRVPTDNSAEKYDKQY